MKKVLLATTALAFSAGFAAAEVTLSGSANMGVKYMEDRGEGIDDLQLHYEIDADVKASTMTDGGLEFGASFDLDTESDDASGNPSTNEVKDPEIYVKGAFGKVTVGDLDPATDDLGMSDLGYDGIGLDDVAEAGMVWGSHNVAYSNSFDAFSFKVTAHTVDQGWSAYAKYDNGQYNAALGYIEEDEGDDSWTFTAGTDIANFAVTATYTDHSASGEAYGLTAGYDWNGTMVTLGLADNDASEDMSYGIGAAYDLGGGATLAGAVGSIDGTTSADFGVTFKF